MATTSSAVSPNKRRKYNDVLKAEALRLADKHRSTLAAALQLGSHTNLIYRWQQVQVVSDVGRVEFTRDLEVQALRARPKRFEQALDRLKRSLVSQML